MTSDPGNSDPDDETTRPDELISLEGPDVETSTGAAPEGSDPLDPTPIPDPDLDAPSQDDA